MESRTKLVNLDWLELHLPCPNAGPGRRLVFVDFRMFGDDAQ